MEATTEQKVALRAQMRERLATLTPAAVAAASTAVAERLWTLPAFREAGSILVYVSKGHEISTHALLRRLLAAGRIVCVPSFDAGQQAYRAACVTDFDQDLVTGKFGILEVRPETAPYVPIETIAVVVVPGLAFSVAGDRLGRGMGFFDRILARARGCKIGVAHDFQLVPVVAVLDHDVAMDFIVTEQRTIACEKGPT